MAPRPQIHPGLTDFVPDTHRIYMRSILETNYSRKLAALKYREVQIPDDNELKGKQGLLHWHWAFECPPVIKLMVKTHLNESKPQGHMRLVLLPIVYNAMGDKANLRTHPLFVAMDREMRRSNYWPLVHHPPAEAAGAVGDDRPSVRIVLSLDDDLTPRVSDDHRPEPPAHQPADQLTDVPRITGLAAPILGTQEPPRHRCQIYVLISEPG